MFTLIRSAQEDANISFRWSGVVKRAGLITVVWASSLLLGPNPSLSQTTSSQDALQKALVLFQVYAVADACKDLGLSFSAADMDGVTSVIEQRVMELNLTEDEKTKIWAAVQQSLQIMPANPSYCLDARQWLAFNLPEVFANSVEKPF